MQRVINTTFDRKVLHLENLIKIEPNARVRLIIELFETSEKKKRSFLQTAKSLKIDETSDWHVKIVELS